MFKSRNAHRRCSGYPDILGFPTCRDNPAWLIMGMDQGFLYGFSDDVVRFRFELLKFRVSCSEASASQIFGCHLQSAKLRVEKPQGSEDGSSF